MVFAQASQFMPSMLNMVVFIQFSVRPGLPDRVTRINGTPWS
jgi:hypothetical protein